MRKIILIFAVLLSAAIISCSGDSDSDVSVGYIDPGLDSAKTVNANKSYTVTGESCAASVNCNAIIYQGTLNDVAYTGIAVNNTSGFYFKMYWKGASLPGTSSTATISGTVDYIKIKKSAISEQSVNSVPFEVTIKNEDDGTYTLTFINNPITVGSQTISVGNTIRAYKYP